MTTQSDDFVWLHSSKQALLDKRQRGLLAHALLFYGSYGAGQWPLAQWLAHQLLCDSPAVNGSACGQCKSCRLLAAQSHPDIVIIDNDDKVVGVDAVRQGCQFLEKTAQLGGNKVVVINRAEHMTEAASNALLKTLEEPTNNSYLLLVCNDTEQLLATITSRCAKVAIKPPRGADLAAIATNKQAVHAFSTVAEISELTDDATFAQKCGLWQSLIQFIENADNGDELVEQMLASEHGMRWLLSAFESLYRYYSGWSEALDNSPLGACTQYLDGQRSYRCLQLVMQANRKLKTLTQANKVFILEELTVDLAEQLRTAS
ncbi:DNA polymerase III subunit delta' [Thalassotalea ponticola]|uniref:DNA polymerase III subunit delta' n=1 Tax=Thalassotalea ponticola TaxID=1523392 RepID=UPI0025B55D77|nr:DNA polymerase III subunit delta' [Thalassotalea ponticola]MDN3652728.1 DNA polymerase III subunit delta' [Thalassotalea ponticola]